MNNITHTSIQCQEDEKNSIAVPKKSENNLVLGPDGSMHEIKTDSIGNEWIDIGRVKKMIRRCKVCGEVRFMFPSVYKICNRTNCRKCLLGERNRSPAMRRASSESKLGKKNHFYGLVGNKNPATRPEVKVKLKEYQNRPEVKELKRKTYVNMMHKKRYSGGQFFNKKACEFMDQWGPKNGYNFEHAMNGEELYVEGYWVDGYDREKNVIFEYDEPKHHFLKRAGMKRTPKDLLRMERIQKHLKCIFIRYNELTNVIEKYEYKR